MLIDFEKLPILEGPGMNHGAGEMSAQIFPWNGGKFILTRLHPNSSIGPHTQVSGDDINYVVSGSGKAVCDGKEELLLPGRCHVCPKGSSHSIVNTGFDDLVLFTVVGKD